MNARVYSAGRKYDLAMEQYQDAIRTLLPFEEEKGSAKKKALYITEKGKAYIENLGDCDIVKPELTAIWETKMQEIKEGSAKFEDINEEMLKYVTSSVASISRSVKKIPKTSFSKGSTGMNCPVCGKPVSKGKYGWYCAGYKDCTFRIPLSIAGKAITDANAKKLIEKGKTGVISGFKSKTGKSFSASIELKDGKTSFVFEN